MATKKTETKDERVSMVHEKSGTHVTVGSSAVDAYSARGYVSADDYDPDSDDAGETRAPAKKAAPAKAQS